MNGPVAYFASLALAPLADDARAELAAERYLTRSEYAYWKSRPSRRRRISFLGGRLAAKLAAARAAKAFQANVGDIRNLDVEVANSGHRYIRGMGVSRPIVSLAHSRSRAVALVAANSQPVGIDTEDALGPMRLTDAYFDLVELEKSFRASSCPPALDGEGSGRQAFRHRPPTRPLHHDPA